MVAGFDIFFCLLSVKIKLISGDFFAGLHGACLYSGHCLGASVCQDHICQCPTGYDAFGNTCVVTGDWTPHLLANMESQSFLTAQHAKALSPPPGVQLAAPPPQAGTGLPAQPPAGQIVQNLPFGSLQLGGPMPQTQQAARMYSSPPFSEPFPPPLPAPAPLAAPAFAPPPPPPPMPMSGPAFPDLFAKESSVASAPWTYLPYPPAVNAPLPPPSPPTTSYAYPGESCIGNKLCFGYSFCWQGTCMCPPNFAAYGAICVSSVPIPPPAPSPPSPSVASQPLAQTPSASLPWHLSALLPSWALKACPPGEIMIDSACRPISIIADYPTGIPCHSQSACVGGSVCIYGLCMCPNGLWKMNSCVPNMAMPIAAAAASYPPAVGAIAEAAPPPPARGWLPLLAQVQQTTTSVAIGSPCLSSSECQTSMGYGSYCQVGVCICRPAFERSGRYSCILKKKAKLARINKSASRPLVRMSHGKKASRRSAASRKSATTTKLQRGPVQKIPH